MDYEIEMFTGRDGNTTIWILTDTKGAFAQGIIEIVYCDKDTLEVLPSKS